MESLYHDDKKDIQFRDKIGILHSHIEKKKMNYQIKEWI